MKKPEDNSISDDTNGGKISLTSISFTQQKILLSTTNRDEFFLLEYIQSEPKDATFAIEFSSSDPEVASVDSTMGQVTALKAGTCTIVAKSGEHQASIEVEVRDTDLAEYSVNIKYMVENKDDDNFTASTNKVILTGNYQHDVIYFNPSKDYDPRYYTFDSPIPIEIGNEDKTVEIQIMRKRFTLTLDLGDGTTATHIGKYEADVPSVTDPTRDGLTFIHWFPELPTTFKSNITCKAVFDNPSLSEMERFKAMITFPAYDNSWGAYKFELPDELSIEDGAKKATLAWEATNSFSCKITGRNLYICPDIVPQDLILKVTITYNGNSETLTHTIHIDPVLEYGYDSPHIKFVPDESYRNGKVTITKRWGNINRYNYKVNPETKEITLSLDAHNINSENYMELSLFGLQNLSIGWYTKGDFEKIINDSVNPLIKEIDTLYNNRTKETLINIFTTNNFIKTNFGLATAEEAEEMLDTMLNQAAQDAHSKNFDELTLEEKSGILDWTIEDIINMFLDDYFIEFFKIYANTWEELKSLVNSKNLYEGLTSFITPIYDTQLCSYDIRFVDAGESYIDIITKYDLEKPWHRQVGRYGTSPSNTNYLDGNEFMNVVDSSHHYYAGNWNASHTELNVKRRGNKLAEGTLTVQIDNSKADIIYVYGKVTAQGDASNIFLDIKEADKITLKYEPEYIY